MGKKKTTTKAEAAAAAKKPIAELSKEDKRIIKQRMAEIKKYKGDPKTTQNTLPYIQMFKDGICHVSENVYSKTIQFFDTNYALATFDEKDAIFSKYCDLLNYFDSTVPFQLTFEAQNRSLTHIIDSIQIPPQNDEFDHIRQEYSAMLTDKLLSGSSGQSNRKFLTFCVECGSYKAAKSKLANIQTELIKLFKAMNVEARALDGRERLETLYYSLNPFRGQPFIFDWQMLKRSGMDTKDFIAPPSLKYNKRDFEIGNAFGAVSTINILAGELPDDIIKEFFEMQQLFCFNIHVRAFDQIHALKFVKNKLTSVEQMKIDEQKKASKAGYDPDILPPSIKLYIDDLEALLESLNTKNDRLFHIGAPPPSLSERFKDVFKGVGKFIKNVYEKEVKKFFGAILFPILIIALILAFIIMIFTSIFSGSGFVLGTYAAQDYDLSEAEKYYTQLANDLNQKVINVGDDSNWKSGLSSLGADTSDMSDKPDNWYWGYSDNLPYTPAYDFDCYKLWSFLCAYYYDFSTSNDDIKYWDYDSGTETVLKELFDDEYEFLYEYDNGSRWEELDSYVYFGGGNSINGGYYTCESTAYKGSGSWTYKFKPTSYTSELGQYLDGDGYCCINSNYRVLNANDGYKLTGYYILDNRYYADSAHSVDPFYWIDNSRNVFFFRNHNGTNQDRSFYGWDSDDAWFMITATDTKAWLGDDEDRALFGYVQKYEWITDCSLYYTVRQKKTFDEAVEDKLKSMEYADERWEYYKLLAGLDGTSLYGNHQTLHNVVSGNSILTYVNDGSILNGYGYDMQNWGEQHCNITDLHEGIDIALNSGSEIYAPFSGKIKDYDSSNHTVILRKDDIQYWYDGNGGTKRDTEVTICNITLASGFSEGDSVKEGEVFAHSTSSKKCDDLSNDIGTDYIHVKVEIDTDGWGWDFIDPRLVLY